MSRLWRRIRMVSPLVRDRVVAALLFLVAEIEVATVGGDAAMPLLMLAAAGVSARIATLDMVVGGANGDAGAEIAFRALVNYRAVPYVDRRVFAAMRAAAPLGLTLSQLSR